MANYLVLQPLWHSKEQKEYSPGQSVNLNHLEPEVIKQLIEQGAIAVANVNETDTGTRRASNLRRDQSEVASKKFTEGPEGGLNG